MISNQTAPERLTAETPAERLARSAFGFALAALIPVVIVWTAVLLSPVSPEPLYAQIRLGIMIGFGLFALLLAGFCGWIFRQTPTQLLNPAVRLSTVLRRRWLAFFLVIIVIEVNFFAFLTLTYVAPTITGPGKFLLVWWSLLLIIILVTVNLDDLNGWLRYTRPTWAAVGLVFSILAALGALYLLSTIVIRNIGIENALRGGLDYRKLVFYDDGQPRPTAQQFWLEQSETRVRWLPYTYWAVETIAGEYINVGENGLRHTPSYVPNGADAQRIYFFGGSTMWGEGARDAYTIAGHTARLLHEAGSPQEVVNYGQTGYVSTQDMMLFQNQIALGNIPDVAVFYQGFNDLYSAYLQGRTGIPYEEHNRISDVEAGRLLRTGQPVLRLPLVALDDYDFSLVAVADVTPEAIIDRWLANIRMLQAIGTIYDVEMLFVWQPALFLKEHLTESEQSVRDRLNAEAPGLDELYLKTDQLLRERIAGAPTGNVLLLSDLFRDDQRPIFYDLVHITEEGNLTVVEAILPQLTALLNTRR